MPWAIGAAVAGGSLLSGLLGADASQSAANTQYQATQEGIGETRRQFDISQRNSAPYRQVGTSALYALRGLMGLPNEQQRLQSPTAPTRAAYTSQVSTPTGGGGSSYLGSMYGGSNQPTQTTPQFDENGYNTALAQYNDALSAFNAQPASTGATAGPSSIASSPDYQFRLNEGYKGLDRGAAARGSLLSGATQKALQEYGQQSASQEFGNRANRLMGIAGIGQNAVNNESSAGAQNASTISDLLGSGAAARAAGTVGAANAWSGGINNATSALSQGYYLNKILGGRPNLSGGM